MNATIRIIEETLYADGSGMAGTYVVYGMRFGVCASSADKVTVTPVGVGSSYMPAREKGMRRRASQILEAHARRAMEGGAA